MAWPLRPTAPVHPAAAAGSRHHAVATQTGQRQIRLGRRHRPYGAGRQRPSRQASLCSDTTPPVALMIVMPAALIDAFVSVGSVVCGRAGRTTDRNHADDHAHSYDSGGKPGWHQFGVALF